MMVVSLETNGKISIHAPREGGDYHGNADNISNALFQSTPPARGATVHNYFFFTFFVISIHAPREGGDFRLDYWFGFRSGYFNPRPPRGGRRSRSFLSISKV